MKFADLFASKRMGVFWSLRLGSEEVSSSDSGGGPGRSGRNLGGEGVWNSSDVDGKERRGGVCARGRGSSSWKGCLVERGGGVGGGDSGLAICWGGAGIDGTMSSIR